MIGLENLTIDQLIFGLEKGKLIVPQQQGNQMPQGNQLPQSNAITITQWYSEEDKFGVPIVLQNRQK